MSKDKQKRKGVFCSDAAKMKTKYTVEGEIAERNKIAEMCQGKEWWETTNISTNYWAFSPTLETYR